MCFVFVSAHTFLFPFPKLFFPVFIPESILNSQQYPKEDELVFLVVPKKQIGHPEENAMVESRPLYLVGLVTRFSHPLARDGSKFEKWQH